MVRSLVGSEMCIRDRPEGLVVVVVVVLLAAAAALVEAPLVVPVEPPQAAKLSIMPAASTKLITFLFMIVFLLLTRISIQKSGSDNV